MFSVVVVVVVQVSKCFESQSLNQLQSAPLHFTICKKSAPSREVFDLFSTQINEQTKMILYYVYMSCYFTVSMRQSENETKRRKKNDREKATTTEFDHKKAYLVALQKPTAN